MRCPACHHDNPDAVKFCGECGTRLEARCPACSASNPPGNKFCHECGESLRISLRPLTGPPLAGPPLAGPPLAGPPLGSPQLMGERRHATIVFSDLAEIGHGRAGRCSKKGPRSGWSTWARSSGSGASIS